MRDTDKKTKKALLQENILLPASSECIQCPTLARKSPVNKYQVDSDGAPCSGGGNEHRMHGKRNEAR